MGLMHSVIDGQTDRQHYDANNRPYCATSMTVRLRSAKNYYDISLQATGAPVGYGSGLAVTSQSVTHDADAVLLTILSGPLLRVSYSTFFCLFWFLAFCNF